MTERIIIVDKEFFAKLAEYMMPEERFITPHTNGLEFYIPYIQRRLIFVPLTEEDKINDK